MKVINRQAIQHLKLIINSGIIYSVTLLLNLNPFSFVALLKKKLIYNIFTGFIFFHLYYHFLSFHKSEYIFLYSHVKRILFMFSNNKEKLFPCFKC